MQHSTIVEMGLEPQSIFVTYLIMTMSATQVVQFISAEVRRLTSQAPLVGSFKELERLVIN
jgi:hypothetical protein